MFTDDYTHNHSDMDYSNHINWFTSSNHNENHRYNDARTATRSICPIPSSSAPCSTLKTAKDCLTARRSNVYTWSTGSAGARRVRNRNIKAANSYLTPVTNWYNAGQCDAVLTTVTPGCTDQTATNYNPNADQDDGSCIFPQIVVYGCTDVNATNYNNNATNNDGSCQYPAVYGCTDNNANNYNPNATTNDGSCTYTPNVTVVPGCTNGMATNFNPNANQDDGSCSFPPAVTYGCTDSNATNYDSTATNDDGLCQYPLDDTVVYGCMNVDATNYNPNATNDDGNCVLNTSSNDQTDLDIDITEEDEAPLGLKKDNTMMYVLGGLALLVVIKMMK